MIPTIEDIVAGLLAGTITKEQAVAWLYKHKELSAEQSAEAAALLDVREGDQLVPKEVDMMARKHLEGKTGVAFLDGYEAWLKALAAAKGEGE